MVARHLDPWTLAETVDLTPQEVRRHLGGSATGASEAARQRLASLFDVPTPGDDPSPDSQPDDARLAGALITRLDGDATAAIIASWLAWTLARTGHALGELDARLASAGLRLHADAEGHLRIRARVRLRRRPAGLASELLARLDDARYRHGLAHLVRGDRCAAGDGDLQPLIDLGVVVAPGARTLRPHPALASAFAAAVTSHTGRARRPALIVIETRSRPRPTHRRSASSSGAEDSPKTVPRPSL